MGDPRGFMKIPRKEAGNRPLQERIYDYGEVEQTLNTEDRRMQAARCMDCGIPFCHWGCPVENIIPEWNELLYQGEWKKAIDLLHATNNFPEFTGRICPAPCESSCVLALHEAPVTIRENEAAIVERAFREGYIKPEPPGERSGKKVALIGSGPAGLACADLLNKWGHRVHIYEKEDAAGGLLRYGIPDFKLNKITIDRRLKVLYEEGLEIKLNAAVGTDIDPEQLIREYDAICVAIGAEEPRDLNVPGRNMEGIHFAMDYLRQQNKINRGMTVPYEYQINAKDKQVVVIGGGDTGSDCVGTAIRQGARSVTQIEIMPKPLEVREKHNPEWPHQPKTLKTTSSHEEGCQRLWSVSTKKFLGRQNKVEAIEIVPVDWRRNGLERPVMEERAAEQSQLKANLVLLSMGFVHPVQQGLIERLGLPVDKRKNIAVDATFRTGKDKIFATGDAVIGASLVVRAIHSGRQTAEKIHQFLLQGS